MDNTTLNKKQYYILLFETLLSWIIFISNIRFGGIALCIVALQLIFIKIIQDKDNINE